MKKKMHFLQCLSDLVQIPVITEYSVSNIIFPLLSLIVYGIRLAGINQNFFSVIPCRLRSTCHVLPFCQVPGDTMAVPGSVGRCQVVLGSPADGIFPETNEGDFQENSVKIMKNEK